MNDKPQILFVDDEENILNALKRLFREEDYEVLTASSGEEGLRVLEASPAVQVVISDYRMPGMNGASFLRAVSQRRPDAVRILLSGYADLAAVVEAINNGNIYRFIPKPWNDDELRMSVANAVERYGLYRQNELLAQQLRKSNEELQVLNAILQERITDEVASLKADNENLMQSHEILDVLPAAVVRLDRDGYITYYNRKMGELFSWKENARLYAKRSRVFGKELNELIDRAMKAGFTAMRTRISDKDILVRGVQGSVYHDTPGIVLTFDDCRNGELKSTS